MENGIEVSIEIENNIITGEVQLKAVEGGDEVYASYLLKNGVVVEKTNWQNKNIFQYELEESGSYSIMGFAKNNKKKFYKKSFPKQYFSERDRVEYENFLSSKPEKTKINNKLEFIANKYPNQDFLLCSFNKNIKNLKNKITCLKNLSKKLQKIVYHELPEMGEYVSVLIADNVEKKNETYYCFSGETILNKKFICGYKEMALSGDYEHLENNIGSFSVVEFNNDKCRIYNDFFNMEPIYSYADNNINIFSNRYHLLLETMGFLNINGVLNLDKVIVGLSNYSALMQQTISLDADILGCRQSDGKYMDVLDCTWHKEETEYFEILKKEYGITAKLYDELLKKGKKEIIGQIKALLNDDRFDNVIFDLSGGLDSRIVYAALTRCTEKKEKARIYSKDMGNDLPIALQINNIYKYEFDDCEIRKEIHPLHNMEQLNRSFFIGSYYAHSVFSSMDSVKAIRCAGGIGDAIYRSQYPRALKSNSLTLEEYIEDIYIWLSGQQISDQYHRFLNLFKKILNEAGGEMLDEKLDNTYLELRVPHHFGTMHPAFANAKKWNPLQSKSIFTLQHLSFRDFENIKLALEVINELNPILLSIPFESSLDNSDFLRLKERLSIENVFDNLQLDLDDNKDAWELAIKEKAKKTSYVNRNYIEEYRQIDVTILHACLYNLHRLLNEVPEIENEIGINLYTFFNSIKDQKQNMKIFYNKITSLLDQLDVFDRTNKKSAEFYGD